MNPCKQRVGRRSRYKREIVKESFFIDRASLIRILKKCFYLRRERDPSVMNAVIERLDADAVANKPEAARLRIPQRNGKHAAKFLQAIDAPFFKGVQDDLGVGVIRFPAAVPQFFELAPDLRVVVNLTVKDDLERAIPVAHRLGGGIGEVNDGKPAMRQSHSAVG